MHVQRTVILFSENLPVVLRTSADLLVGLLLITPDSGAADSR